MSGTSSNQTHEIIIEPLVTTLNTLHGVRNSVTNLFKSLAEGPKEDSNEESDRSYPGTLQKLLQEMGNAMRDLETQVNALNPPSGSLGLGNTGLLSLDPSPDKLPLYHQVLDCYKWTDKVRTYTGIVHGLLNANNLKRSQMNMATLKRKRPAHNIHNVQQHQVDNVVQQVDRLFVDMNVSMSRPYGCNAVLQVTLGRVLRAVVTFKGLLIEWVLVRAYNEPLTDDDGKVDMYTQSQYKVFQKVTENAIAAMLHFYSPGYPDLSVKSFFTWLHSFTTLFSDVCKKCGMHLHNHMPPTWREFRNLHPYHEECKP